MVKVFYIVYELPITKYQLPNTNYQLLIVPVEGSESRL